MNLETRRTIRAAPEQLFEAWTQPAHLRNWWGPAGVECTEAHVDLRVGGTYRIANRFPDGRVVWIAGTFEAIEPPHRLVYSWSLESQASAAERVTVRFEPRGEEHTEVVVLHERIASDDARRGHEQGWTGCLDGLEAYARDGAIGGPPPGRAGPLTNSAARAASSSRSCD